MCFKSHSLGSDRTESEPRPTPEPTPTTFLQRDREEIQRPGSGDGAVSAREEATGGRQPHVGVRRCRSHFSLSHISVFMNLASQ